MKTTGKIAIVFGATGLVGETLLHLLLQDDRYSKIVLFSRRSVGFQHDRLEEHLVDLLQLEDQKKHFKADEVFCCVGTTNAKTPDKQLYEKIDYGIPVSAAKLCKENNIQSLMVVSALGARASSTFFYNRVKGEMEDEVLRIGVPKTHLLQPSMIGGNRKEKRPAEYIVKKLMLFFGFLLQGPTKKYRVIHPKEIALGMIWLANHSFEQTHIPSETIKQLAQK